MSRRTKQPWNRSPLNFLKSPVFFSGKNKGKDPDSLPEAAFSERSSEANGGIARELAMRANNESGFLLKALGHIMVFNHPSEERMAKKKKAGKKSKKKAAKKRSKRK